MSKTILIFSALILLATLAVGAEVGFGVTHLACAENTDLTPGLLRHTGEALDIAIDGPGYFEVGDMSGETLYTRDGHFSVSSEGQLVVRLPNRVELLVEPQICIPSDATRIDIGPCGVVLVKRVGRRDAEAFGRFQLARVVNPAGLVKRYDHIYAQSEASGAPTTCSSGERGVGAVRQFMLENLPESTR